MLSHLVEHRHDLVDLAVAEQIVGPMGVGMFARTLPGAGPRPAALALTVGQLVVTLVVLQLRSLPIYGTGTDGVSALLGRRFPTFNDGVPQRWEIVRQALNEVLQELGMPGVQTVLLDLCAMVVVALLLVTALAVLAQWRSFDRVGRGLATGEAAVDRAVAFLESGSVSRVAFWVVIAIIAGMLASGAVGHWMETASAQLPPSAASAAIRA